MSPHRPLLARALKPLALAVLGAFSGTAIPGPDSCSGSDCQGDQSAGISITAPPGPSTVNVFNLSGPINPSSGTSAIRLQSSSGLDLTINSGTPSSNVILGTTAAPAISIISQGTPPTPQDDPLLNVPIPGAGAQGGALHIESYSDITTGGANAHGISAVSSSSGYSSTVISDLEAFLTRDNSNITFTVTSAKKPDGTDADLSTPVRARVAVIEQATPESKPVFKGYEGEAGSFTFTTVGGVFDGGFSFDPGTDFDDLAVGASRTVSVAFTLDGYRDGTLKRPAIQGELSAQVTKTENGFEIVKAVHFDDFGDSDRPQTEEKALPDLNAYVQQLIEDAKGAGAAGNSVSVFHHAGTILTTGSASYGVSAESRGKTGSNGRNGGGFWSFGTKEPTQGGGGNAGGDVSVHADGSIITQFQGAADQPTQASIGVFAHSSGGDGGRGGNGGTYYYGRRGGTGGSGGLVEVFGSGTIDTSGHCATGILALSEGGDGGDGGDGADVTGGGAGGFGGKGGAVHVEGNWTITTRGIAAHGIWAKSVGGNAGTGGSGGWLAGAPAPGGQATDGGPVTLISGGTVTTSGTDAYGLFAQSVGGFGGSGGGGGGIFYSRGGNGNSAGSGGAVSLSNASGGEVITYGAGAHAVFAQSVGGGGGAGGGASAIVGVGGTGGAGGMGGTVTAVNDGVIRTHGENARGLYAQSVGGGGGDGGNSSGLVSVGGSGSGTSNGGNVTVTNTGVIETGVPEAGPAGTPPGAIPPGTGSNAIFAQSIGGGGGSGGSSTGWFSVGGSGGGGGDAGTVVVNNSGARLATAAADATAIYAQSIGGGGGKGGNSTSVGAFASVAIGGNGAAGGAGSNVSVNSTAGDITTQGNRSLGIFAQSIGGGGGDGGFAFSTSGGIGFSLSVSVGGKGGGGGNAAQVDVVNNSHIVTAGNEAGGLFAESVGGGGGTGGFAISAGGSAGVSLGFALGGAGGDGGDASAVTVHSTGTIETGGKSSTGLQAQSVGGGGGNGGFAIAGTGGGLGAFSFGLGGTAGGGGNAGTVSVESDSRIITTAKDADGLFSRGLFAQSVGGGGGNGGYTVAAAGAGVGAGAVGIGGKGGDGGSGSSASVTNRGAIDTWGDHAEGLFAQSVGGGGGSGGFSISGAGAGVGAGTVNIGGAGGGGGSSSTVAVVNEGNITTRGYEAHGLFAQSVGGGGGTGGYSISASGAGVGSGTISVGGSGGDGGDSNRVDVMNHGAIDTSGQGAIGLYAQSVGGGGGSGGFSIALSGAGVGSGTFNLGGSGGGGGDSQIVAVENTGSIVTRGADARGLVAQSVGGGGGNGGFSITGSGAGTASGSIGIGGFGGDGGNSKGVTVKSTGTIDTVGERATGLFAQSAGGGGGSGGFSIAGSGAGTAAGTFSLGGKGGGGGSGDTVSVESASSIATQGTQADGIFAQSLGGGGGNGGFSITGSGAGVGSGSIGIGGFAGDGGSANNVQVIASSGSISTSGWNSNGIFAQSVGGGGGSGGFSIAGTGAGTASGTFNLGGSGGGGGDGASVHVDSGATIRTLASDSYGIFAQSLGGGGGNGGFSITGAGAGTASGSIGVGGFGGDGGAGKSVTVKSSATIETSGDRATGLFAQSLGGGGGNGGFSIAGSGAGTGAGTFSLGGAGGGGGGADTVSVESTTSIVTRGSQANGIFAQSLGGGGGNGGFSIAGSGAGTGSGTLGIGGFAGDGGSANTVTVIASSGTIDTSGWNSSGIVAESVGGGGGNGGFSISGSGAGTAAGTFNLGGSGGGGGDGAAVRVDSGVTVRTQGSDAYGIFAQSLGGGGGNGGFSITGAGAGKGAGSLGIGGSGGDGGDGNNVNVTTTGGTIGTSGERSTGLVAQSLGGGGGNGGFSFAGSFAQKEAQFSLSVGGTGGGGGQGKDVVVNNSALIATEGSSAHGIFAQSVGGGGGTGGSSVSFASQIGDTKFNMSAAIGGSGGSGNIGGTVNVVNAQSIVTAGNDSHGIFAQSLGGGGGAGGSSLAIDVGIVKSEGKPGASLGVDLSVGGTGGDGNHGGAASITNRSGIETFGDHSIGVFAQSIGGGGGAGGTSRILDMSYENEKPGAQEDKKGADFSFSLSVGGSGGNASNGGAVTVQSQGNIITHGIASAGIQAQSIGGGGGDGGDGLLGANPFIDALQSAKELTDFIDPLQVSIAVGGSGGSSGDGGAVTVTNNGNITTLRLQSYGIFAQSIGGGGGVSTLYGQGTGAGGSADVGLGGKIGIGGGGGASGNGGAVHVEHTGNIDTSGNDAHAIFAQSVGGGGGVAGSVDRGVPQLFESQPNLDIGLSLAFGRDGGGGGDGGAVSVSSNGLLVTRGAGANGIFAQSVGGGGGLAGSIGLGPQDLLPIEFAGSVGGAGSAGSVTVAHTGSIITLGNQANGIFAQSAGGQGMGGAVQISVDGDVVATGTGSHGIFAQSRGDSGAGDIAITVNKGTVQGGTGSVQTISDSGVTSTVAASGIRFQEGANNSLTNRGMVTTATGVAGMAISGTSGNEAIVNFGTVTGVVDLGSGANSFHNKPGATFNSGAMVNLGAANALTNDGTLSPGGAGTVLTSSLTGRLQQSASGTYLVSLDLATNTADKVSVSGPADLAGGVAVQKLNTGMMTPGKHKVTILSSSEGVSASSLSLATPPSAVIRYELVPAPTEVTLAYGINFAPAGLNANQAEIGRGLNNAGLGGGSARLAPLLAAAADQPDGRSLANAYNHLSPETYLKTGTAALSSNMRFSDAMHSCAVNQGPDRFIREGECDWLRFTEGRLKQDATDSNMGFNRGSVGLSGAAQRALGDGTWYLGGGFAYEQSTLDVAEHAHTTGDLIQIGAILKKGFGATWLSADVNLGYGTYNTSRFVNLPTPGVTASSNQEVMLFAGRVRLAHAIEDPSNWYLKPMIDLGLTHGRFPGFEESGAGAANLRVESHSESWVSVTPALEIGGETQDASGILLRPYAKLGITYLLSGTSPEITASFQGAPLGVAPFTFTVQNEIDKSYGNLEIGLGLLTRKGVVVRAAYIGSTSQHTRSDTGMIKLSLPF